MSTYIYTMPPKLDAALAKRLETATGLEAACCLSDLRARATEVRATGAFEEALSRAKALSDEKRLLALALLKRSGEMCGCEIQAALDLTHATVSHHMTALAAASLVVSERRGKWVYYRLHPSADPFVP